MPRSKGSPWTGLFEANPADKRGKEGAPAQQANVEEEAARKEKGAWVPCENEPLRNVLGKTATVGGAPVENPKRTSIVEADRELAGNCGNQAEQSNTKSSRQPETKRARAAILFGVRRIQSFSQPPMGYNPDNPGLITKTGLRNGRQPSNASRKTCVLPDREDYYLLATGQVQAGAGNRVDYSFLITTRILEAPQQNYKAKELLIARSIYRKHGQREWHANLGYISKRRCRWVCTPIIYRNERLIQLWARSPVFQKYTSID